jgi:hypothetical protein
MVLILVLENIDSTNKTDEGMMRAKMEIRGR